MAFRDRVKELRRVRAGDLVPDSRNPRRHPEGQKTVLRGVLEELGVASALIARELPDGRLKLIDGHCRSDLDPEQVYPVVIVDLSEEEAGKLLAVFDPLTSMATLDVEAYRSLVDGLTWDAAEIQRLVDCVPIAPVLELPPPRPKPEQVPENDRSEELQAKWATAEGQLWTFAGKSGEHRLIIGDCRDPEVIARLCPEPVHGCITSPPYAEQRKGKYGGTPADKYVAWWEAVQANVASVLTPDGSFLVNIKPHVEDGQRVLYVFAKWCGSGVGGWWMNTAGRSQASPVAFGASSATDSSLCIGSAGRARRRGIPRKSDTCRMPS